MADVAVVTPEYEYTCEYISVACEQRSVSGLVLMHLAYALCGLHSFCSCVVLRLNSMHRYDVGMLTDRGCAPRADGKMQSPDGCMLGLPRADGADAQSRWLTLLRL